MVLGISKTANMPLVKLEYHYNDRELCSVTVVVMLENLPDLIFNNYMYLITFHSLFAYLLCDS